MSLKKCFDFFTLQELWKSRANALINWNVLHVKVQVVFHVGKAWHVLLITEKIYVKYWIS